VRSVYWSWNSHVPSRVAKAGDVGVAVGAGVGLDEVDGASRP